MVHAGKSQSVHSELRDDRANQRLRVQCRCPSVLSARSGKVKLLAIGLPLVHTLLIEVTHATTTIEFNSREFHGCVPGCIDITQSQKALIVVRLVIDRVQSTFYSGVNGVHRASVKLSRCNVFREFHGCARGCMVWPRWRVFFNPLFPFFFCEISIKRFCALLLAQ